MESNETGLERIIDANYATVDVCWSGRALLQMFALRAEFQVLQGRCNNCDSHDMVSGLKSIDFDYFGFCERNTR